MNTETLVSKSEHCFDFPNTLLQVQFGNIKKKKMDEKLEKTLKVSPPLLNCPITIQT